MLTYSINDIFNQITLLPLHLKLWLIWLVLTTFITPLALARFHEARVVLLFQFGNAVLGTFLGLSFGLVRLLGLAHVVFWTPVLIYMASRLSSLSRATVPGIWARVFVITVSISLALDYLDVIRYALGDRALLVRERTA